MFLNVFTNEKMVAVLEDFNFIFDRRKLGYIGIYIEIIQCCNKRYERYFNIWVLTDYFIKKYSKVLYSAIWSPSCSGRHEAAPPLELE